MIELAFIACSLGSTVMEAPKCAEVRLTMVAESVTPFTCFAYGQLKLMEWDEAHPGKRRKPGYSCRPSGYYAKA